MSVPFSDGDVLVLFKNIIKDHPRSMSPQALTYMRAAVEMDMRGHMLHVQVLYVQGNLDYWRGDEAKRCKLELRLYMKAHCNGSCHPNLRG